ncbi:MAG: hypothetical protein M0Z75_15420 [Nitrospiraceae bacterium]|nr:hypothetical protein [Nitrospiraceae bacterium]
MKEKAKDVREKGIEMTGLAMKRAIAAVIVLLASLLPALPAVSSGASAAQGAGTEKDSCGIISPASGPLLVTEERPKIIPFSFMVRGSMAEVRFLISEKDKVKGITLLEETAKVKGGVASSRLSFNILDGMPLGRHALVIQVIEASGGAKICSGTIPYIILPGAACMCRENRNNNSLGKGLGLSAKKNWEVQNA